MLAKHIKNSNNELGKYWTLSRACDSRHEHSWVPDLVDHFEPIQNKRGRWALWYKAHWEHSDNYLSTTRAQPYLPEHVNSVQECINTNGINTASSLFFVSFPCFVYALNKITMWGDHGGITIECDGPIKYFVSFPCFVYALIKITMWGDRGGITLECDGPIIDGYFWGMP